MRNDVKSIGFSPRCPRLTLLLLQHNSFEEKILDPFFDNVQGLKVLDLSYSGISALLVSLSNLENLCALILRHCSNLAEVPSLARLTKLRYLDFSFSRRLTELPQGMGQLANLRHLDFSFTSVQNLMPGIRSKFNPLELLILGSPMIGVLFKGTIPFPFPVRVEEIISCHKLSLVHMHVLGFAVFRKIVKWLKFSQLTVFKFVFGFDGSDIPELFDSSSVIDR